MKLTKATLRKLIKEEIEGMEAAEVEADPEVDLAELAEEMDQATTELHRKLEELEPQIRKVFQEVPGRILNRYKKAGALERLDNMDLDAIMRYLNYISSRYSGPNYRR